MDNISLAIENIAQKLPDVVFKLDEPLKNHTTFKIGGPVRGMFFPKSTDDLTEICDIFSNSGITVLIMGNGSNILASDERLDLIAVNTSMLTNISLLKTRADTPQNCRDIEACSGALLSKVAIFAYENGLERLEFAHGIPGTVGGAVVMNAGAYGGEMKDVVFSTTVYDVKKGTYTLTAAESDFSYRHSRFSDTDDVLLSSIFRLKQGEKEKIKQNMEQLSARRRESQPLDLPSGGSTFKRPREGYAAALIDKAGLKGFTIGTAQVSDKHTGFIVNKGNASFDDTIKVIEHVQNVVFKQFGIQLEPEIKVIKG